jgi:hypothetical protein
MELDSLQHLVRSRVGQVDRTAEHSQMVTTRTAWMEVRCLKHRANRQRGTVECRVRLAEHERAPTGRRRQTEKHAERRRFPRTVRAEEAGDRARFEREGQVIDSQNVPESLRQRLSDDRRQRSTARTPEATPRHIRRWNTYADSNRCKRRL